ncbi:MAG: hypothetical protein WA071_21790 [Undibacterium umbellatum]|uniref:hypothetical protein n=1 Tax=Undibacterium umbellatum TaxID=2762300 RepID=UPI003BB4A223
MKAIISVWMQPVYARSNAAGLKILYALLGIIALLPLILFLLARKDESDAISILLALAIGIGVAVGVLLVFWFVLLVPSVALQYSPANAGLVPQLRRNMKVALAIPVLLMPAILALTLVTHLKGLFFQSWLIGVFAMLVYVATLRSKWVVIFLVLLSQLPMWWGNRFSLDPQASWNQPALLMLVGLGLTAAILHWVFAIHGDQHFKREESFSMIQKAMNGEEVTSTHYSLRFFNPYDLLMRWCMVKVDKTGRAPAAVAQLIPFAFGAQVFWLTSFVSVALMSAGLSIYFAVFLHHSSKFAENDMGLAYAAAMVAFVMLPVIYVSMLRATMYQRKGEHSLLLLAAALPPQAEQTRIVLHFLLCQFFGLWLLTLLIVAVTMHFSPASTNAAEMAWLACFCLLPLSVMSLYNYARIRSRYETALLLAFALPAFLGLASLGMLKLWPALPVWLICLLIVLVTLPILRWRWQILMQANAVFPAGRAA